MNRLALLTIFALLLSWVAAAMKTAAQSAAAAPDASTASGQERGNAALRAEQNPSTGGAWRGK